jgi:protein TonB
MKSFDEIVFEKRNKEYGSYVLRKKYGKMLMTSVMVALFLFVVLIGSTVIGSMNKHMVKDLGKEVGVEMLAVPKDEMPAPPPPPPAEIKMPKFIAPTVVDEDVETNIGTQDEMNTRPNIPVSPESTIDITPTENTAPSVIEQPKPAEIFTVVEEQPMFYGDLYGYLISQIKYPEEAKELGIQGKVFVTFIVEKDGSITDVKILRGIGGGCDEEAIRVIKSMPNWSPGKQSGNAVRVQFNLPVKFTLQ